MRRFFVPPELSRGNAFELPEREARHAVQVLRLRADDEIMVLDGAGGILSCRIEAASKRSVRVAVVSRQLRPPLTCAMTLVQAIPKGPAFEAIVQKATELGTARIVPLLSERVVAQVGAGHSSAKVEKWRQVAIESIKQCGAPWLPQIEPPTRLEGMVGKTSGSDLMVVCSLQEQDRGLGDVAAAYRAAKQRPPKSVVIWIGPEGDFTPAEYAAIANLGAVPITLGPLILRAETAAIACLAVANHELNFRCKHCSGK
jgi:16S rRNA (uracil1498-N3)-methyltransferase